jgi:hypothetical protein
MRTPSRREWGLIALVPVLALAGYFLDREDAAADPRSAANRPAAKASATKGASPVAVVASATPAAANPSAAIAAPSAGQGAEAGFPRLKSLRPAAQVAEPGEAFVKRSWYVPPPPPPPVVRAPPPPPPAPTAPPLPFTYLGAQREGGQLMIFLVKGDSVLTVKQGDVLDGTYRVEGVEGTKLGLTYLPLNIRQTLEVGPQS